MPKKLETGNLRIGKTPGYEQAREAARYIQAHSTVRPLVGIILGSGLSGALRGLRGERTVAYRSIPHFPRPSVAGHAGLLHLGRWGNAPVAVLDGRMHLYEGYTPAEAAFPARALALAGVETLIVTCAAGGIARQAVPGSLMVFSDHLNFQGANPLSGPYEARWGERFVDLTETYDPDLRRAARKAARACRARYFEGLYAALLGPNYETPAEIRALRRLGADAVGMSAVGEVLAARQAGLRVLAIAAISNRAAGLSRGPLRHQDVLQAGTKSANSLACLLNHLMPSLMLKEE